MRDRKVILSLEVPGPRGMPTIIRIGDLVEAHYGPDIKGTEQFVTGTVQGFTTRKAVVLRGYTIHNMPNTMDGEVGAQYIARIDENIFVYFTKPKPPKGDNGQRKAA